MIHRLWSSGLCSIFAAICCLVLGVSPAMALGLDEALALARENLPSYRAAKEKVWSTEDLHRASLSPYLPSVDGSTSLERKHTTADEYDQRSYDVSLSYKLFDGGERRANRRIAELNVGYEREEMKKTLYDLELDVKVAFYTVLAQGEIVRQRRTQLQDARKDHEVAEGRRRLGVAKLSDVLQASVRVEQARFNVIQAERDLRKALAELNSLVGRPLGGSYDLEGTLDHAVLENLGELLAATSLKRPEVMQAETSLEISKSQKNLTDSAFYPTLSVDLSYRRTEGGAFDAPTSEARTAALTASWNLFEWGKFFKSRSSRREVTVSGHLLDDTKRQLLLNVHNAYEDYLTAGKNIDLSRQQLLEAEHNYRQAFGEFKVGKGDILSLVQAEKALADAREQLVTSRFGLAVSKASLERAAGIEKLESLSSGSEPSSE